MLYVYPIQRTQLLCTFITCTWDLLEKFLGVLILYVLILGSLCVCVHDTVWEDSFLCLISPELYSGLDEEQTS